MNDSCRGAGEHKDSGRGGGARWNRRGTCTVCGKNLALTSSGRIPRHVPAKDRMATLSPVQREENRKLGNAARVDGCDFCFCGCKYWENDRCVDCGATEPMTDGD